MWEKVLIYVFLIVIDSRVSMVFQDQYDIHTYTLDSNNSLLTGWRFMVRGLQPSPLGAGPTDVEGGVRAFIGHDAIRSPQETIIRESTQLCVLRSYSRNTSLNILTTE